MSKLYLVATPIGNLSDISLRALETLKSVDIILCEDTRVSQKLLKHYNIQKKCLSYHEFSGHKKEEKIISFLNDNKNIALISDAGTPLISDPGAKLITSLRKDNKVKIVPIPGPSALTAILSVSPWPFDKFVFLGFLPHKKGRQAKIKEIFTYQSLVVLFESKHRIIKLITELSEFKDYEIEVFLAREITKEFESFYQGSPKYLLDKIKDKSLNTKGEFTLIIKYEQKK